MYNLPIWFHHPSDQVGQSVTDNSIPIDILWDYNDVFIIIVYAQRIYIVILVVL